MDQNRCNHGVKKYETRKFSSVSSQKLHFWIHYAVKVARKARRILGKANNHLPNKDAIKKSFVANPTHHY